MVKISPRFTTVTHTHTNKHTIWRADGIKVSDSYCASSKWVCVYIFYEQDLHAHIIYYPESRVNHRVIFKPDCLCLLLWSRDARSPILLHLILMLFLLLLLLLMLFFLEEFQNEQLHINMKWSHIKWMRKNKFRLNFFHVGHRFVNFWSKWLQSGEIY